MKSGEFSIELVNAESKEPMKEFIAADGKVYVEAEPDLEYFIRCYREKGSRRKGSRGMTNDTFLHLQVDGTSLGYNHSFFTKTGDLGLWKRQNGVTTFRALKMILRGRSREASNSMPPIGNVTATFHKIIYSDDLVERKNDNDKTNCLDQAFASAPAVASGAKKVFASVSGSTTSVTLNHKAAARWKKRRQRGRRLGEMTIQYTSTLGLSKLGVLAPTLPVTVRNSASATNINSLGNDDDDDRASVSTERKSKRVKTDPALSRIIFPDQAQSGKNIIDLTADDPCPPTNNVLIDHTGVIDLTGA